MLQTEQRLETSESSLVAEWQRAQPSRDLTGFFSKMKDDIKMKFLAGDFLGLMSLSVPYLIIRKIEADHGALVGIVAALPVLIAIHFAWRAVKSQ